jgi:hypothetical protein
VAGLWRPGYGAGGCGAAREAVYFTQEDPIGLAGGLNLYGYAGGDPINNHDPFGLFDLKIIGSEQFKADIAALRKDDANVEAAFKKLEEDANLFVIREDPTSIGAFSYGGIRPNGHDDEGEVDDRARRANVTGKVKGFARVGSKEDAGAPPAAWRAAHEAIHLGGLTGTSTNQVWNHPVGAFGIEQAKWNRAGFWHPADGARRP